MDNEAPLIRAQDLWKTFAMGRERVHALAGLDLQLGRGSMLAILGPSGSGKSTLLHLVGGLDRPSAGMLWVNGVALDSIDEDALALFRRRQVGFVFQSFNLIPNMTAFENVIFPFRFSGADRTFRQERGAELLELVGLSDRATHKPNQLSGGQQQRVAIARALAHDPGLILADEPTGNLDSQSGIQILQLLQRLSSEGRTVLVVSHDPRVLHFASHTLYILDGRAVDEGEYNASLALAGLEVIPNEA